MDDKIQEYSETFRTIEDMNRNTSLSIDNKSNSYLIYITNKSSDIPTTYIAPIEINKIPCSQGKNGYLIDVIRELRKSVLEFNDKYGKISDIKIAVPSNFDFNKNCLKK